MTATRAIDRTSWERVVWESDLGWTLKLVALAYAANLADPSDVRVTWRTIMARTALSERAVAYAVKGLVADGWLTIVKPARRYDPVTYRLSLPGGDT